MYEWSWGIFAKKTKFHDAGGPGTVVSPTVVPPYPCGDVVIAQILWKKNLELHTRMRSCSFISQLTKSMMESWHKNCSLVTFKLQVGCVAGGAGDHADHPPGRLPPVEDGECVHRLRNVLLMSGNPGLNCMNDGKWRPSFHHACLLNCDIVPLF